MSDMYTPDWVRDAIFYQIFPDRFAKSERVAKPSNLEAWDSTPTYHGYKGGDLLGIVEHLDYLQDLGINALYFNPIFQSAANHRYHTHDYYRVDPMLGGDDALRELIDEAHKRDMKVVLDGVFNHASRGFFQFNDILENNTKSAYLDWFHVHNYPLNAYDDRKGLGYQAWWGMAALPKFNTHTPAVREYLWGVATYWLAFGIDGWRLDVPNEIADEAFWQEFRYRCREVNPDCYIVGEIWDDASPWLAGDQFDAVMNYPFTRAIFGFTAAQTLRVDQIKKCGYQHIPPLDGRQFAAVVDNMLLSHRQEVTEVQLNLLGSHDTARGLTIVGDDEQALKMSYQFLLTYIGAPCIYYGDELGLDGEHDPLNRQGMPWEDRHWNMDFFEYCKHLIHLRCKHTALRRGSFQRLYADEDVYAYTRVWREEIFIGLLNVGSETSQIRFALPDYFNGYYQDALSNRQAHVEEGRFQGSVAARSGALFQLIAREPGRSS